MDKNILEAGEIVLWQGKPKVLALFVKSSFAFLITFLMFVFEKFLFNDYFFNIIFGSFLAIGVMLWIIYPLFGTSIYYLITNKRIISVHNFLFWQGIRIVPYVNIEKLTFKKDELIFVRLFFNDIGTIYIHTAARQTLHDKKEQLRYDLKLGEIRDSYKVYTLIQKRISISKSKRI